MSDHQASGAAGPQLATDEERLAMRAEHEDSEGRARDALRLEVLRHLGRVDGAWADINRAVADADDHLLVEGLRRLLALGLQSKGYADQLEQLLPQTTRLFVP